MDALTRLKEWNAQPKRKRNKLKTLYNETKQRHYIHILHMATKPERGEQPTEGDDYNVGE